MAVTAVTITSGPTVVGRSVTISGTLNRDGGGTNNTLNFLSYTVGYVSVYTITRLSDSATFLNAAGTAESGIAWTWTGTLPEGNYLGVSISLNDAPYTTFVTSANVGVVELRKPLAGIWTPNRDSRGLFTERFLQAPGYKDNFGANNYNRRQYHYATPDGQVYWSAVNNLARYGEYGNLSKAAPTPYGVAMDLPQGWEWPVGTRGGTSTPGGYSTSVITYVSIFYLHNSSKYHDPVTASKYAPIFGDSSSTLANASAYWSNANGEQAIKFGQATTFWGEALQNITVSGIGNGLHCLVIVQCNDTRSNGHRVFLDGHLVGSATYTTTYLGAKDLRPYAYWGSISKSGLDIGSILFQGAIEKFYASDEEAKRISLNPYSYFFRDAPKTSAKQRLFGGVLSLPDPPTEFTSTKAGKFLPQRWKNQPQGALTIDRGHSLSRGLCAAWHPAAQQYIGPGLIPSPTPGTYAYQADTSGMLGVKFNGAANSRIALPAGSAGFAADYSGTRLVLFRANAAALGLVSGPIGSTLGMRLNSATTIGLVASGSQVVSNVFYTIPTSTSPTVALCTANSASTQTRMHVNGQLLLDTTYSGYAASTAGVWVGAITNHPSSSNFFLALSWDRALSIPEATAIQENPWQIFKPNRSRTYFLPATTTAFKGGRFLPQRWKTQPQGTGQLNWNNPITKGLVWASAPTVNSNFELVSNKPILFTNSSGGEVPNSLQNSFSGRTFAHGQSLPNNTLPITSDFTMAVVGELSKQTPNNLAPFLNLFPSFSNTELRLFNNNANGFNIIGFTTNSSDTIISTRTSVTTSSMFGRKFISVSTPAVVNQSLDLYVNNIISNSITSGLWNGTSTSTFSEQAFYGQVLLPYFAQTALIWNRRLSDGDRFLMSENPWQIFMPNPGRIYFLPGATKRGKFLFLFS